jgi:hypothetical protein
MGRNNGLGCFAAWVVRYDDFVRRDEYHLIVSPNDERKAGLLVQSGGGDIRFGHRFIDEAAVCECRTDIDGIGNINDARDCSVGCIPDAIRRGE